MMIYLFPQKPRYPAFLPAVNQQVRRRLMPGIFPFLIVERGMCIPYAHQNIIVQRIVIVFPENLHPSPAPYLCVNFEKIVFVVNSAMSVGRRVPQVEGHIFSSADR